jgi:hypothetical protein
MVKGEMKVRPMWVTLLRGKNDIAGVGSFDLREDGALKQGHAVLDLMAGFYVGKLGARINYSPRDFAVTRVSLTQPGLAVSEVRFSYSVVRLGADIDLIRSNETRLGFNIDYDLDRPIFTEGLLTLGGKQIVGPRALTCGMHLVYNPLVNFYGVSGIIETRASWPVYGASVTDWEIAGGVLTPTTVLGTVGLKGGYRQTTVDFKDTQRIATEEVDSRLDVTVGAWFGELAYYY